MLYLLNSTTDVSLMCCSLSDLFPPNTITQTISLVTLYDETECRYLLVTDCRRASYKGHLLENCISK